MKFSEMPYARPDLNELKQQLQALTDRLKAAPDYAAAREAFLAHADSCRCTSIRSPRWLERPQLYRHPGQVL